MQKIRAKFVLIQKFIAIKLCLSLFVRLLTTNDNANDCLRISIIVFRLTINFLMLTDFVPIFFATAANLRKTLKLKRKELK